MILKVTKQLLQSMMDLLGQVEDLIHQTLVMDQEVEQELKQQGGMQGAITDQQTLIPHMNIMGLVGLQVEI